MIDDNFIKSVDAALRILTYLTVIISLIITAYQVRRNAKTNGATYWLELRKMFCEYNEIHRKLQIDDKWRNTDVTVDKNDILEIVGYMGLFEHCYDMIRKGLIDRTIFKDIYSYRLHVIMDSPKIVNSTLVKSGRYWKNFRALAREFGHTVPERQDIDVEHQEINYPVGWEE